MNITPRSFRPKKINDGFPLTGPKYEGSVCRNSFFSWYRIHITHVIIGIASSSSQIKKKIRLKQPQSGLYISCMISWQYRGIYANPKCRSGSKFRSPSHLATHVRLQCNPSAAKYALRCTSKHTSLHFKGYCRRTWESSHVSGTMYM